MKKPYCYLIALFFQLIFMTRMQNPIVLECIQYSATQCIRCPISSHVYQNQCIPDISGCVQYKNGNQCIKCNTTYSYMFNRTCILLVPSTELPKYTQSITNVGDQYGQTLFQLISLIDAQKDKYFLICDNFMKRGQYGHFISRTAQPIISVHSYDVNNTRQFKILYEGSGGGILLCIIGIKLETNQIQLRSFVVIGVTQLVDQCIDYTTQSECKRCSGGFHLDNKLCYQNIPKCVRYYKNICIQCKGYSLLVQNRCIADCQSQRDTRSIRFYHSPTAKILPNIDRISSLI